VSELRFAGALLFLLLCVSQLAPGQQARGQRPARVGVVLDGRSVFTDSSFAEFQREIAAFFGPSPVIQFPPEAVIYADWSRASAGAALDRLFADRAVDAVIALGPIGSSELGRRTSVPKPAIAALIIDAELQELPVHDGSSGVRNLTYVNVAYTASRTLQLFHEILPFHKLAVLIHPGMAEAVPKLLERATAQASALGIEMTLVPATTSAANALQAIPPDVDAVYLTPLEQLPASGVDSVISGLITKRLPTFSYTGRTEVERGVLASFAPRDDLARRARRVAGDLQRILNGEDAGTLPVNLASVSQLTLNMATARAIGFSPGWNTMTEADLLNLEPPGEGPEWTLAGVAREAVRVSLTVQAADRTVASAGQDVRIARADLLPQVVAAGTGTAVREETATAAMGQQAQRQGEATVSFSQVLFSEQSWAQLGIAGHQKEAREAEQRQAELDITLDATSAFLNVLRTRTIAQVERVNLRVTRSNLETAQLRERTGSSSRADVYRWESELATSRRSVIAADARMQIAALELNRVLERPLEEPFRPVEASADDSSLLTGDPRLFVYFGSPETFALFREFMVAEGRTASPELRALDAVTAAQDRFASAAGRALWVPTFSLEGGLSSVLSRSGAGAEPPMLGGMTVPRGPDFTWNVRLQASLPLFTGFSRKATQTQATIDLDRLVLERRTLERRVDAQVRTTLQTAGASWASIEQARVAATAARSNFELVSDAYTRGTASIITLLDAQQAALNASVAAANAEYDFLLDLMRVERAVGVFTFFRTAQERAAFLQRLDDFFRAARVPPRPR